MRIVHWTIVALVAVLLATGLYGGAAVMVWHMRAGEALLALVLFRILWGFAGSANARFASFVRGPRMVLRYLRSLARPPQPLHATHNPAGGWMVVALLAVLLIQCGLGLFTHDDVMTEGPLRGWSAKTSPTCWARCIAAGGGCWPVWRASTSWPWSRLFVRDDNLI